MWSLHQEYVPSSPCITEQSHAVHEGAGVHIKKTTVHVLYTSRVQSFPHVCTLCYNHTYTHYEYQHVHNSKLFVHKVKTEIMKAMHSKFSQLTYLLL